VAVPELALDDRPGAHRRPTPPAGAGLAPIEHLLEARAEADGRESLPVEHVLHGVVLRQQPPVGMAGLDPDHRNRPRLEQLIRIVDAFSNGLGPGLLDVHDPEKARLRVINALDEFERDFVRPALVRRTDAIADHRQAGTIEAIVHQDILTALPRLPG